MLEKTIVLNDRLKKINLEYSDNDFFYGDTVVKIYDCYKLSLVLTNGSDVVIGNKIIFPQRGDIIILRPYEIHFGRFPNRNRYAFVSFLIPVDFFDHIFQLNKSIISPFLDNSETRINLVSTPELYRNQLIAITENMLTLMKEPSTDSVFDVIAFARLIEVLEICNRFYYQQREYGDTQPLPAIISKTMQKIDENFPDFPGLTEIAEYCCCSVTYLTQAFRNYTGRTIYSYLTERRLEYARLLLKNGVSVTEAACRSGFSDTSRFILQFKKHFDITPGKYRSENRNRL